MLSVATHQNAKSRKSEFVKDTSSDLRVDATGLQRHITAWFPEEKVLVFFWAIFSCAMRNTIQGSVCPSVPNQLFCLPCVSKSFLSVLMDSIECNVSTRNVLKD